MDEKNTAVLNQVKLLTNSYLPVSNLSDGGGGEKLLCGFLCQDCDIFVYSSV